jgi:hypothetical protein
MVLAVAVDFLVSSPVRRLSRLHLLSLAVVAVVQTMTRMTLNQTVLPVVSARRYPHRPYTARLEELDMVAEEKAMVIGVTHSMHQTVHHSVRLHRHASVITLAKVDMAVVRMAGADGAAVAAVAATSEDKAAAKELLMDLEAKEGAATRLLVLLSLAHPPVAVVLEDMALQAQMAL